MASREKEPEPADKLSCGWLTLVMVWALVCGIATYRGLIRMELEPPHSKPTWDARAGRLEVSRVCLVPGDAARCETRVHVPASRETWHVTVVNEQGRTVRTLGTVAGGEEVRWDGRDQQGRFPTPGFYSVVARWSDAPTSPPLTRLVWLDPAPPRLAITQVYVSTYRYGRDKPGYSIAIEGKLIDPPPAVPRNLIPSLTMQWRHVGGAAWRNESHAFVDTHLKDPSEVKGELEIPASKVHGREVKVRVATRDTTWDGVTSPTFCVRLPQEED
jgi:hypothetical protein